MAKVLPGTLFFGSNTKDLRLELLNETSVKSIIGFENKGIFQNIDNRYRFGITVFRNGGSTDTLQGIFQQRELTVLEDIGERTIRIPSRVLKEYSPEARTFPMITTENEVGVLNKIVQHEPVGDTSRNDWFIEPYRELDRSKNSDLFTEDESIGDYPVYQGKNMYQYCYTPDFYDLSPISLWGVNESGPIPSAKRHIQSKGVSTLKRQLYYELGGVDTSKSQKKFVNELLKEHRSEELSTEDVLPDSTTYRIAIREVTNSTNERTLVATVIPKGSVCVHTLHTVRPYYLNPSLDNLSEFPLHSVYEPIFSDRELFAVTGLLNSLPFDFLMRTKVETHIVMYKLEESQMPRLTEGDNWFEYISLRAARLNCYGEAFAEMRERLGGIDPATDPEDRKRLQAEIDAAAFHAYGLDRDETAFVLDDFHRVQNPRLMTDDYFELVLEKYDALADQS